MRVIRTFAIILSKVLINDFQHFHTSLDYLINFVPIHFIGILVYHMNYSISEKSFYKGSQEIPQRYRCKCKKKTD